MAKGLNLIIFSTGTTTAPPQAVRHTVSAGILRIVVNVTDRSYLERKHLRKSILNRFRRTKRTNLLGGHRQLGFGVLLIFEKVFGEVCQWIDLRSGMLSCWATFRAFES